MKEKKKLLLTVLGVTLFIVTIAGITYAAFVWASDPDSGFISGKGDCFVLDYTKGIDILSGSLDFGSTYTEGLSTTVKVKLSDSCNIEEGIGTLYLNTNDNTSDYLITNKLIRYQVLENGTEVTGGSGQIQTKGNTPILSNINITGTEKEYTVYIWINIADVNDNNMSDIISSVYDGSIKFSAESR